MNKSLLIIFIFFGFSGCVVEPPPTWYTFKIQNKTNDTILVKYQTIKDSYEKYDTLLPEKEFSKTILTLQCFYDYKDSTINHFFNKIEILNDRKLKRDLKKYDNWVFYSNLKNDNQLLIWKLFNRNCKSDSCYYVFLIIEDDFAK